MQVIVHRPVEVDLELVRLTVNVRYGEEDIPNDFFGRSGNTLSLELELGVSGGAQVKGWPGGTADIYMKVCDEGAYAVVDTDGGVVRSEEGYVPSFFPGDHYWGDYLILQIGNDGRVTNWRAEAEDLAEWLNGEL